MLIQSDPDPQHCFQEFVRTRLRFPNIGIGVVFWVRTALHISNKNRSSNLNPPHLTIDISELLNPVRESDDFCGTNEGEVQRVEIDDDIFPFVVGQGDLLELPVHHGLGRESGRRLLDLGSPGERTQAQVAALPTKQFILIDI